MTYKTLFFLIAISFSFLSICYYNISISKFEKYNSTNPNIKKQNNLKNWEDEWTVLNDTFYFKKSAAYLFKDYNYLYLYFVAKTRLAVNFNLKLKIYESNSNQHLEEIFFENLQSSRIIIWGNRDLDHGLYTLKAYFKQSENLKKYLTRKELAIHAFPFISNQIISNNPIILKIKNIKEKLKKDIMVCSKMLSLENKDYKILEDWIRISLPFNAILRYLTIPIGG